MASDRNKTQIPSFTIETFGNNLFSARDKPNPLHAKAKACPYTSFSDHGKLTLLAFEVKHTIYSPFQEVVILHLIRPAVKASDHQ